MTYMVICHKKKLIHSTEEIWKRSQLFIPFRLGMRFVGEGTQCSVCGKPGSVNGFGGRAGTNGWQTYWPNEVNEHSVAM